MNTGGRSKSETEQEAILAGYRRFLNGLAYPLQVLVRVVPTDIEAHLAGLRAARSGGETLRRLALDHEAAAELVGVLGRGDQHDGGRERVVRVPPSHHVDEARSLSAGPATENEGYTRHESSVFIAACPHPTRIRRLASTCGEIGKMIDVPGSSGGKFGGDAPRPGR